MRHSLTLSRFLRARWLITIVFGIISPVMLSACNLVLPSTQPTIIVVTATPQAQNGSVASKPTNKPADTTSATLDATEDGPFGPVTGPNLTPPPTFTQGPLLTVTAGPTTTGPTPVYGAVIDPGAQVVSPTVQPSDTPIPATPLAETASTTTGPAPTYGSVIGPNYTEPPSLTPVVSTPNTSGTASSGTNSPNATLAPMVTAGPSPTPGPVLRKDLMGIQVHAHLTNEAWDAMLNHVRSLGLGWVKVQVQWNEMEPQKGQFSLEYKTLVLALQRARSPQIKTLVSIAKAPDWSRPADAQGKEDGPPDNPQDLADFVAQLIRDVKPEALDAIEIWNEPNLIREWHGKPINGAEYMKYFDAAYQAVVNEQKAQPSQLRPNHRLMVIAAGPAPTSTVAGVTMDDRLWIQQLYNAGFGQYGDDVALGVHPYSWANPPDALCCNAQPGITGWYEHPSFYFRNTLDAYHQIMVKNSDTTHKMWITEFGYASYDGLKRSDGNAGSVNPASAWETFLNQNQQADYVMRAFNLAQQPPYYDYVGPMMLWNLNFAGIPTLIDNGREEAGFSLLDQNNNPRPVYQALQNAAKQ